MGQTIGIEFLGDIKGWPQKESGRIQVIVSDYADEVRERKNIDLQSAVVRGAVHGGSKSSESHNHVTVKFKDITGQDYDAHIAVTSHYGISYSASHLWKDHKEI